MRSSVFASSLVAFAVASAAHAGLVNPQIPGWAGSANTQFAQWDSFTQPSGGANAPDSAGSAPFTLFNFAPGAFITGAGNLYSQSSALYIMIMGGTLNNASMPQQVVMNVATAGSVLNNSSVRISFFDNNGNNMTFMPSGSSLRYDAPAIPQGSTQTWAFTWNLSAMSFAATGFRVEFMASAPSMSLDAVRMDMQYVPTPGALALVGVAGIAVRRRRRH